MDTKLSYILIDDRLRCAMTKEIAREALEWDNLLEELKKTLESHIKSCKHWSMGLEREEQNRSPEFPEEHYRNCDYCGKPIEVSKNGLPILY